MSNYSKVGAHRVMRRAQFTPPARRRLITIKIKSGTLLILQGAQLPAGLQYESEPFVDGWTVVKNLDPNGLDQIVRREGWTLFFIAGAIVMIGFGSDPEKASAKALKSIIKSLKGRKFNCLEISEVSAKRFLGVPYVRVGVHLRHIQEGLALFAERVPFRANGLSQNPNAQEHAKESDVTEKWRQSQI